MKGSNDFEILRSLSVSRDLEKSVQNSAGNSGECIWHDITGMIYSEKAWSRKSVNGHERMFRGSREAIRTQRK